MMFVWTTSVDMVTVTFRGPLVVTVTIVASDHAGTALTSNCFWVATGRHKTLNTLLRLNARRFSTWRTFIPDFAIGALLVFTNVAVFYWLTDAGIVTDITFDAVTDIMRHTTVG
jgi:hypothetical protein